MQKQLILARKRLELDNFHSKCHAKSFGFSLLPTLKLLKMQATESVFSLSLCSNESALTTIVRGSFFKPNIK